MICQLTFSRPSTRCSIDFCTSEDVLAVEGRAIYVFDSHTRDLFPDGSYDHIVLPPGEPAKSLDSVERILHEAVKRGLSRDSFLLGVGGGVICDMTAFAASLFMRGCRLILIPTTLLAMVDAAVGGKTGVDFGGYKNLAGTFYPAEEVRILPQILRSLPEDEYINGLAEVLKYAFLGERGILDILEHESKAVLARDLDVVGELIRRSVLIKSRYIEEDPVEQGVRAHLNLGHTFAHALETSGGFTGWKHGQAVAWGMVAAMKLGHRLEITPDDYVIYARSLIESFGFKVDIPLSEATREKMLEAMMHDKKNRSGTLRFVLQGGPGQTDVYEVPAAEVREIL